MEKLYVKRPIYPLISLLSSVAVFCIGLLVSKRLAILYLLAALTLIYILFGYTRVLVRAIPLFLLIGTVIGAGAVLTSRQYMAGIQTLGRTLLLAYSFPMRIPYIGWRRGGCFLMKLCRRIFYSMV